jgi:hypothetical protein
MDFLTTTPPPAYAPAQSPKPQCSLKVEELQEQARVCNEKKLAAKNAQEASDRCVVLCFESTHVR